MNIFAVSPFPSECARVLNDKRLNKMTTETAQLLSTAIHEWGYPEASMVYKRAYPHHPVTQWVHEHESHFGWTAELLDALAEEWYYRMGKMHGAGLKVCDALGVVLGCLDEHAVLSTPDYFPNCTPYKDWSDVHAAYRQTLVDKWRNDIDVGRPPRWTRTEPPVWWSG